MKSSENKNVYKCYNFALKQHFCMKYFFCKKNLL